ncbi:MAG: HU family DNA-binding protein [Gammaproteobacteria bacterium]|nr:HU family DNA-binding protein [Gammaproteobacteria bacterium]
MNKAELLDTIADKLTLSKADAGRTLEVVLDTIVSTLKRGDEVAITGFGSFKVKHRAARAGRNPKTGEEIKIAAANVPGFKPGKAFKDAVAI